MHELFAKTTLIEGWKHPLSDALVIEGEDMMNSWLFASLTVGYATGRITDDGTPGNCIRMILEMCQEKSTKELMSLISTAVSDDAAYLDLLNQVEEGFNRKASKLPEK